MQSPSKPVPRGRAGEPRGDRRLAALLDALEQLLTERPISAIGIQDITTHAGITRSAFYFYFASKNAALAALVNQLGDEIIASATVLHRPPEDDPASEIREGLQRTAEHWLAHRHLLAAIIESEPGDPAMRELWSTWMDAFIPPVAALIDAERAAGRAIPGPPANDLARTLAWANERNFYRVLTPGPPPADVDKLVTMLSTIWVRTIYGTP